MTALSTSRTGAAAVVGSAGIALLLALTGCSTPSEADESRSGSSPSEAPTETQEFVPASATGPAQNVPRPVKPKAVHDNSAEGARAAAKYFWEVVDYGRLTGETEPIAQMAHYVCESCNQLIYKWEQIYADGAWAALEGETRIKIVEIQQNYSEEREEDWTAVLFEMDEPASQFYQDGVLNEDASTDGGVSAGWWLEMVYEEDDEQWVIDWLDFDPAFEE